MKDSHLTLRLPAALAQALARWARARGVAKSAVAREAVARYLAEPAGEPARRVTGRELALRWPDIPRLDPADAAEVAAEIERGRTELPVPPPAWE
jgi:hypothetical protein